MIMKFAYISVKERAIGLMAGLSLITMGIVVQTKFTVYLAFVGMQTNPAAIFLIVIGISIFFIGFFGCCRAYRRNYCLTVLLAGLFSVALAAEIAAVISASMMEDEVEMFVRQQMRTNLPLYNSSESVTVAWDKMQLRFSCCGITHYTDWQPPQRRPITNNTLITLPGSCCRHRPDDVASDGTVGAGVSPSPTSLDPCDVLLASNANKTLDHHVYTQGCLGVLRQLIQESHNEIILVCSGLFIVQIVGIILTCSLARSIKFKTEET